MKKSEILFSFYVSGGAGRLLKLLKKKSPVIKNTALVVNDNAPNALLETSLSERKIEYVGINYKDLGLSADEKNSYLSKLLLEKFKEFKIDYCFCFGGRILRGELLEVYKNRIINFHPSILPAFPGIKAVDQALEQKTFLLGNTAHFVDKGVDTGPVIMQNTISSRNYTDYDDVLDLQLPMLEQIYSWIIENRLKVKNGQVFIDEADYTEVAFYPKLAS